MVKSDCSRATEHVELSKTTRLRFLHGPDRGSVDHLWRGRDLERPGRWSGIRSQRGRSTGNLRNHRRHVAYIRGQLQLPLPGNACLAALCRIAGIAGAGTDSWCRHINCRIPAMVRPRRHHRSTIGICQAGHYHCVVLIRRFAGRTNAGAGKFRRFAAHRAGARGTGISRAGPWNRERVRHHLACRSS